MILKTIITVAFSLYFLSGVASAIMGSDDSEGRNTAISHCGITLLLMIIFFAWLWT